VKLSRAIECSLNGADSRATGIVTGGSSSLVRRARELFYFPSRFCVRTPAWSIQPPSVRSTPELLIIGRMDLAARRYSSDQTGCRRTIQLVFLPRHTVRAVNDWHVEHNRMSMPTKYGSNWIRPAAPAWTDCPKNP
jgi:hypothetical protein